MDFKICAAVVSYGNRFQLLKQVLDYCNTEAIAEIVVIDNGCSPESKLALSNYRKTCAKPIHYLDLQENTGSALGFKTAIQEACNQNSDYVLILDDDNIPRKEALKLLTKSWAELAPQHGIEDTIVLANRIDRSNFKQVILSGKPTDMLQRKNNYLGFHWADIGKKISERILGNRENKENKEQLVFPVAAGPYSGLFFHKKLVAKHGLPEERFVLYMDDFDYTHRLFKEQVGIYLLADCIIDDLESSVYLPKKKGIFYHSLFEGRETAMFYAFRNMLIFSNRYLLVNRLVYLINKYSFWSMIIVLALLNGKPSKLKILKDAAHAGENNILGKNSNYPLT